MGTIQGFKDPNDRVLGPKYHNINGIWDLKPYYLGPWTFRVMVLGLMVLWGLWFIKGLRTTLVLVGN